MSQSELLRRVVSLLESNGIEYMVTGSIVSSSQGQPRSTHDIDLVVNLPLSATKWLTDAFGPPDYYLDEISVREAISRQDMFNLLKVDSGDKVDFWMLGKDAYDHTRFARRIRGELAGIPAAVSRPEDTILQKLRWAELSGGSEKQFADARGVFELQHAALDVSYIERWVSFLGVEALWSRLKAEAKPLK